MSEEKGNAENTVSTNEKNTTEIVEAKNENVVNTENEIVEQSQKKHQHTEETQEFKELPTLWNPKGVGAMGILINPIFGGAMLMMNWKAMGNEDAATKAILWSILFMLGTLLLPLPPIVVGIIWFFISCRVQVAHVSKPDFQYIRRSWLWPVLIALALVGSIIAIIIDAGAL